jgi:hypothetical protein
VQGEVGVAAFVSERIKAWVVGEDQRAEELGVNAKWNEMLVVLEVRTGGERRFLWSRTYTGLRSA